MRRRAVGLAGGLGAAGGIGGGVAAALAAGWIGATLLIVAIVAPILAICWIVADSDRPQRLAVLVTTWREGATPPRRALTTKSRDATDEPRAPR